MFKRYKKLWPYFIFCMLVVLGVIYMLKNSNRDYSGDKYSLISIGSAKFRLDKRYLYVGQIKKGDKKIRDEAVVEYFSFDFFYPSLSWVERSLDQPGWGDKVSVYISEEPPFDFKEAINRKSSVISLQKPEAEFNSDMVKKYSQELSKSGPSSGDRDLYIYGDYEAYLSCKKKNEFDPEFPSCKLVFAYKDMEVSASFSRDYKFEFLKIKAAIEELLFSFETTGVEE